MDHFWESTRTETFFVQPGSLLQPTGTPTTRLGFLISVSLCEALGSGVTFGELVLLFRPGLLIEIGYVQLALHRRLCWSR